MYAIRSSYALALPFIGYHDGDLGRVVTRRAHVTRHADLPFGVGFADRRNQGRITSYNVCYTKLLRGDHAGRLPAGGHCVCAGGQPAAR